MDFKCDAQIASPLVAWNLPPNLCSTVYNSNRSQKTCGTRWPISSGYPRLSGLSSWSAATLSFPAAWPTCMDGGKTAPTRDDLRGGNAVYLLTVDNLPPPARARWARQSISLTVHGGSACAGNKLTRWRPSSVGQPQSPLSYPGPSSAGPAHSSGDNESSLLCFSPSFFIV